MIHGLYGILGATLENLRQHHLFRTAGNPQIPGFGQRHFRRVLDLQTRQHGPGRIIAHERLIDRTAQMVIPLYETVVILPQFPAQGLHFRRLTAFFRALQVQQVQQRVAQVGHAGQSLNVVCRLGGRERHQFPVGFLFPRPIIDPVG